MVNLQSLSKSPRLLRSPVARGLSVGEGELAVNPQGGDQGAGIIRGCAIITKGEALGHSLWIDDVFLSQVADAINAQDGGIKERFTHPDLSGDGLGRFLGRVKNASIDGDLVRGDIHFSPMSRKTPEGDLGGYVLGLALEDPEAFGNSIAFAHDWETEEQFEADHTVDGVFTSPDPLNVHGYTHARLGQLHAVDVVDSPAANPKGLFHRGQEVPQAAEELLSYGLGLTSKRPEQSVFDVDPDRLSGFMQRFLGRHGLQLTKGNSMPPATKTKALSEGVEKPKTEAETTIPSEEEVVPGEDTAAEGDEAVPVMETEEEQPEAGDGVAMSAGQQFIKAFGTRGAVLFAEGKTFAQASAIVAAETSDLNAKLTEENKALREQLKAGRGEDAVSFQSGEGASKSAAKFKGRLGSSLGAFAASIKIPGRK